MNWKRSICCVAMLLGASSLVFAEPPSGPQTFSVTSKTQIPGLTLKPGSYSIRVVDRLSDRVIVRVDAADGSGHSTFIGLENADLPKPSTPGLVPWTGSGNLNYVRGWYFSSLPSVVEFVYPKADAAKIALKADTKVPAIDPESEGRVSDKNLSHDDMELVTLWLLSSTRVGPGTGSPAVQAERYHAPVNPQPQVATAETRPAVEAPASAPVAKRPAERSQPQVASLHRPKPVVATLPHTASNLPLVYLLGAFSLLGGAAVRTSRKRAA